ncbi:MAG: helix-turn-helix transcriptional regulator [Candidatus Hydrogenedentes bacterium]|nr:helix-turn-helix transcriptional regulator [Candidatus Hydrogenedentota bacterium]
MIVNRISRLMGERREGVTDVSRATGIPYSSMYELYADRVKRIDLATLDKLCKHFGVTPCDIFEYLPDPKDD